MKESDDATLHNWLQPLALAILAPIVFSILLFHLLMERNTLVIGVVSFLLWLFLA